MKTVLSFLLLTGFITGFCQDVVLIPPPTPVVAGTAFQVQYVIRDPAGYVSASTPVFDSCKVVSGPHFYKGTTSANGKTEPILNITYTLIANAQGTIDLGRLVVHYKDGSDKISSEGRVLIIPPPHASFTSQSSFTDLSLYAPKNPSDLQKLISENLFVKATVDKPVVYEGEPVVATFKLYSRLQSSSQALKSPSFYGFSVLDMFDINKAHTAVENINGKVFNTSVLRKVQLYPLQAGTLQVDPMYIQNTISFMDTLIEVKPEYEREIVTTPVQVKVKPLPKPQPTSFTGAVGSFRMKAALSQQKMEANAQGKLLVTISGKGNFIQFGQPSVTWPRGIESFDAVITDSVDKTVSPQAGERTYEIPFVPEEPGHYELGSIRFAYFDIDRNEYDSLSTDPLSLEVTASGGRTRTPQYNDVQISYWWLLMLLPAVILFIAVLRFTGRTREPISAPDSLHQKYYHELSNMRLSHAPVQETALYMQRVLYEVAREQYKRFTPDERTEAMALASECQRIAYTPGTTAAQLQHLWKHVVYYLGKTL
jgi:hypothetical protein